MHRLFESKTWQRIDRCVGQELGELLGEPLATISAAVDTGAIVHTSQISLTFTAGETHLRLRLGVDDETGALLRASLLGGDESSEAMDDALREMANTAGGAIKRHALDDGYELTISLPSSGMALHTSGSQSCAWVLEGDSGIRISCVIVRDHVAQHTVSAVELREGMVLARDVLDSAGALVASAGMSLTSTTVRTLSRRLPATAKLDVSYSAA